MAEEKGGAISRFLTSATKIEASEIKATLLSFSFIFLLMVAYNMLKPARDALAPEWSDVEVAWLWTINFILSVIAVSLYGWFVSKAKLKNVVPAVYAFFAASFVVFYLGTGVLSDSTYLNKAFYVWLSLFSLFHVSVFWSLMSDLFSKDQAPRLFAFIASGASIGTIVGGTIALVLAKKLGTLNLMLIAATILVMTIPLIVILRTAVGDPVTNADQESSIRGNPFAGFRHFISNPYLLGIAVFIFLYTFIGSFAYFELKNLMADNDRDTNTAIWAGINLAVNGIAIGTAMFATSRIATKIGLGKTLALVPLLASLPANDPRGVLWFTPVNVMTPPMPCLISDALKVTTTS